LPIPKKIRAKVKELYVENPYTAQNDAIDILKECEHPDPADLIDSWYRQLSNRIAAEVRSEDGVRIAFNVHNEDGSVGIINTDKYDNVGDMRKVAKNLRRKKLGIEASENRVRARLYVLTGQISLFD